MDAATFQGDRPPDAGGEDVTRQDRDADPVRAGLIKELNHRVKNNLQMLLTLLSSAARESESGEARAVLDGASRRVAVMGAAQQVLYGADSTGTTFCAAELIAEVVRAVRNRLPAPIAIAVAATNAQPSNDMAVPLALILNELLTNAARHAGAEGLLVSVALVSVPGGLALSVNDNGRGFAGEPESHKRSSGLGLVRGLARQLGGDVSVRNDGGASCTVLLRERSLQ